MTRPRPPAPWTHRLTVTAPGAGQDVILAELRRAILDGAAPPGTAIVVDDVAARFTVSRIPVREALKTLVGEGLVDHEPRAGYRVAQLVAEELVELYIVRAALETAALARSAARATTADDAAAAAAYQALSRAIADGDARGHHRESRRFHLALAEPSGMFRLLRMFESAWNLTEPLQPMSHVTTENTALLNADHRVMLDAFLARDADTLVAASNRHYERLEALAAGLPRSVFGR